MDLVRTIKQTLFRPVDIAFLVYFRIATGVLIMLEFSFYLMKLKEFGRTDVYFSYLFFEWIRPWPLEGLYLHILLIAVLGFSLAVGFYYRITTILLFLAQVTLFLMEKSVYQSHHYLYWLVSFLLIFLPAHRAFSYDASRNPSIRLGQAAAWVWYLLLFQISVVYVYAGVAKLYSDWITGRPMVIWMYYKANYPIIGPLLGAEWFPYVASIAALVVDLTVVPLMLFTRTRAYGFVMALLFHLANVAVFGLGTFPWFAIVMTSLFFSPSWPRKLFGKSLPALQVSTGAIRRSRWALPLLSMYVLVQLMLPLRHRLYPLSTAWTDEGDHFSWRMLIRDKAGNLVYLIKDQDDRLIATDQGERLNYYQNYILKGDPDMILQYAHYLAEQYQDSLKRKVKIYVESEISLNGWRNQPMVDPTVDLAQEKRTLGHYKWILPWKPVSPLMSTTQ
ncbi:MAG: HTTM domain-containing protein [Cytophagales bacterium]|nr:HTTM domain-containing protein [Cytophagales bacterium]